MPPRNLDARLDRLAAIDPAAAELVEALTGALEDEATRLSKATRGTTTMVSSRRVVSGPSLRRQQPNEQPTPTAKKAKALDAQTAAEIYARRAAQAAALRDAVLSN